MAKQVPTKSALSVALIKVFTADIEAQDGAESARLKLNQTMARAKVLPTHFKSPKSEGSTAPEGWFESVKELAFQAVMHKCSAADKKLLQADNAKGMTEKQKARRKQLQQNVGAKVGDWKTSYTKYLEGIGSKLLGDVAKPTPKVSPACEVLQDEGIALSYDGATNAILKSLAREVVRLQNLEGAAGDINLAIVKVKQAMVALIGETKSHDKH